MLHQPHLAEEMVASLERYEPPLTPEFLAIHTKSLHEVYAAADTLRFSLMTYLELSEEQRNTLLERAIGRRSNLEAASTGDGQFAVAPFGAGT